jgi:carboxyl-terminal processing protease
MKLRPLLLVSLLAGIGLSACKKEEPVVAPSTVTAYRPDVRDSVYAYVQYAYLWNENLPASDVFKPQNFATPGAVMEAVKKYSPLNTQGQPLDRWSYVTTATAYSQQQQGGQTGSFGLFLAFLTTNDLRVRFVLPNSPAAQQGLDRGWRVRSINGITATAENVSQINTELGKGTLELQVESPAGTVSTKTIARGSYNTRMVFDRRVLDVDGKKVGYLNFFQFVNSAVPELREAIRHFQQNNVTDVVVDMRYNGGGNLRVADTLANLLIPTAANGSIFYNTVLNERLKAQNQSYRVRKEGTLNLNRFFFITTGNTASASELIINGLKPYAQTILIGEKTYGKPVGQSARYIGQYMPFATAFKYTNARNEGDFFDGLPVQRAQVDDVSHGFGDPNEACLSDALYYIRTGTFRPARLAAGPSAAVRAATEALRQEPLVREGGATLIVD